MGDLGNIVADASGVAAGELRDEQVMLTGEQSVVGRSMIVFADEDDLGKGDNSQPGPPPVNGKCSKITGNAGARVAGGRERRVGDHARLAGLGAAARSWGGARCAGLRGGRPVRPRCEGGGVLAGLR